MEGIALILIGAALFCQSWYFLGLYPDGRTVGVYVGGLGLAALIAITLDPILLIGDNAERMRDLGGVVAESDPLAEITVMKILIITWAGYAVGVAAQGIWDYDERALGFFGAFAAAVSAVALFYFATTLFDAYGNAVVIGLTAATLVLSVLAGMIFFYLAVPFNALRLVAGWFLLVGSVAVAGIGLAAITTVIEVTKP